MLSELFTVKTTKDTYRSYNKVNYINNRQVTPKDDGGCTKHLTIKINKLLNNRRR